MSRTPFHVVGGFLGTGKTTALRHLVAARAGIERAAVVVNDFGEAAVDAALLGDGARVSNIPGGCVCCTAPEGLVDAVKALLDTVAPDRIYIEPSGLALPWDVLDMLARGPVAARLERRPLLLLIDPSAPIDPARSEALLDGADVVVFNRVDLASPAQRETARERVAARWPAPMAVVETSHGVLPDSVLSWAPGHGPLAGEGVEPGPPDHDHDHDHDDGHEHGEHGADGTGDRDRTGQRASSTAGFVARSWVFPPEPPLRYGVVAALVADPRLVRVKGLVATDLGWFRVDRAGGRASLEPTPWRRDTRIDVIGDDAAVLDAVGVQLADARSLQAEAGEGVVVEGADGSRRVMDRAALDALPGQVPDVGRLVPGRVGGGVWLREVLRATDPPAAARFVLVAADGMVTPPVAVAGAGEAVLLTHLEGAALPAEQGGPFRVLGPSGAGRTACANVKGVVRIRVLPEG